MTKTARLSTAPGCIGSPTIRAMEHPMCASCVFRTACGKIAAYHREQLVEIVGERGMHRPSRRRDLSPKDHRPPQINGKQISENARSFMKELVSAGYDKKELNDLLKTDARGASGSRSYPWLIPALQALRRGVTMNDLRGLLKEHGVRGLLAASRASQFIAVLSFYELITFEEKTEAYWARTGEIA